MTPGILAFCSPSISFSAASAMGTSCFRFCGSALKSACRFSSGGLLTDIRPCTRWTKYSKMGPNLETPSVVNKNRSGASCLGLRRNMLKFRVLRTGLAATCEMQAIATRMTRDRGDMAVLALDACGRHDFRVHTVPAATAPRT